MVQRIILFLLLIMSFDLFSQANAVKLKTNLERCKKEGVYVENCWISTDSNGKAKYITSEEASIILSTAEAGAVDSIYSFNDTLYVVYFDAPTLKYKSSGLNGIYSATNNNKECKVNTILYPTTAFGALNFQTSTGTGRVLFNSGSAGQQVPITLFAQSSAGVAMNQQGNVLNNCFTRINVPSGQTWDYGVILGTDFVIRHNTSSPSANRIPFIIQNQTTATTQALKIFANGNIGMSNYQANYPENSGARIPSTGIGNVAFWDVSGIMQLSTTQTLADSLSSKITPRLYLASRVQHQTDFAASADTNIYEVKLVSSSVNVNCNNFVIGKPYKFYGTDGTLGDIDFVTTNGSLFINNGLDEYDGIVGNFSYEIIRTSSTRYVVTYQTSFY